MNSDEYLSGKQVLARYQISEMTLWRWLQDESLNFPAPMKIRRRNLFSKAALIAWEQSQQRVSA